MSVGSRIFLLPFLFVVKESIFAKKILSNPNIICDIIKAKVKQTLTNKINIDNLPERGGNLMRSTIKNKFPPGKLTNRERFRRVMHYQNVDRIPNFEFGYWNETLPTWHSQGLPKDIDNEEKAYSNKE